MANIRFVNPPGDNKIRQFPRVHNKTDVTHITTPFCSDVIHITTPQTRDVLHITTPKRKNSHIPQWDLFITSENKSKPTTLSIQSAEENRLDTDFYTNEKRRNSLNKRPFDSPESAETNANKKSKDLNQNSLSISDNVPCSTTVEKIGKNENSSVEINKPNIVPCEVDAGEVMFGTKTEDRDGKIGLGKHDGLMQGTHQTMAGINPSKCRVMKLYSDFHDDLKSHLSDVSDEEIDNLPEIQSPKGVLTVLRSPTTQRQSPQSSTPLQNEMPARHRPVRRSVSEAALVNNKAESFFRNINDTTYYDIDGDEGFEIREMASDLEEMSNVSRMKELTKLNWPARDAWGNNAQSKKLSGSENALDKSKQKDRVSIFKTTVGKVKMESRDLLKSRSESCDSLSSDRLRMRRFALAQPEKMIISQEIRERIEKDVEKRKGSMVRKVSQFLNVQLGLNKEEDLI